jgi:GNAT superfamily N-acetyltransferase
LPPLQKLYPDPKGDETIWTRDEQIYHEIHHPKTDVYKVLERYPSHLHIDLVSRAQGQGNGKKMMQVLLETLKGQGSKAVHLGMFVSNTRAFHFYKKMGFHVIEDAEFPEDILYLGLVFE